MIIWKGCPTDCIGANMVRLLCSFQESNIKDFNGKNWRTYSPMLRLITPPKQIEVSYYVRHYAKVIMALRFISVSLTLEPVVDKNPQLWNTGQVRYQGHPFPFPTFPKIVIYQPTRNWASHIMKSRMAFQAVVSGGSSCEGRQQTDFSYVV